MRLTPIDLLALLVIGLIAIGVLLPATMRETRQPAHRIKCSSNLRQIGLALKMYAEEQAPPYPFPRANYADDGTATWGTGGGHIARPNASPFNPPGVNGGTQPNDVTAALFLLLRTQDISPNVFICPSSDQGSPFVIASGSTIQDYTNWSADGGPNSSTATLSYSFQNPYATSTAVKAGFAWDNKTTSADFAIAADMNSGTPLLLTTSPTAPASEIRSLNSPMHDRDGQNVLYADGHVDWATNPFVGAQNDNIYVAGRAPGAVVIAGSPIDAADSILLPTWDAKVPAYVAPRTNPFVIGSIIGGGVLVFLALVVVARRCSKSKPQETGAVHPEQIN